MILAQQQDHAVSRIQPVIVVIVDNNITAVLIGQYAAHPHLSAESPRSVQIQQCRQQLAGTPHLFICQRTDPGFNILTIAGTVIRQ
ncbi:hypothetical protein D3C78_1682310 [compost metagenome]